MSSEAPKSITQLLLRWKSGEDSCLNELIPLVEQELRQIARRQMRRERLGHTLQTTALINEAYLRLVDQSQVSFQNRLHFLGVASGLMRHILVDHARRLCTAKRGGATEQLPFDEAMIFSPAKSAALVALDDALEELSRLNSRKAQVVELRFFGGLTVEETAEVLRVDRRTIVRDWNFARAWLKRELGHGAAGGE